MATSRFVCNYLFCHRLITRDLWDLNATNDVIVQGYIESLEKCIAWDRKEVATSEAESEERSTMYWTAYCWWGIGASQNFTACSIVVSFRWTFVKTWYRNVHNFYFLITYGVCKERKYCNRMSEKKKFSPFDKCSWFVCLRRRTKKISGRLSVWMSGCTYVHGFFMWTQ